MNLSVDSKLKNNTKSIKENEHSNSNSRKKKIKNIEYLRDIYYWTIESQRKFKAYFYISLTLIQGVLKWLILD